MSKGESLTDGERLFKLKHTKNDITLRLTELDTWLATVGRDAKTKQDRKVKGQFIQEKMDLQHQLAMLKKQIALLSQKLQEQATKQKLSSDGPDLPVTKLVTDHALVRWLERKHNINVAEMKDALYREATHAWNTGKVKTSETGKGIRATAGDMVFVLTPDTKVVMTCYQLHEEDVLNR